MLNYLIDMIKSVHFSIIDLKRKHKCRKVDYLV